LLLYEVDKGNEKIQAHKYFKHITIEVCGGDFSPQVIGRLILTTSEK